MKKYEVIVVGNGVIGCSIAYALSRKGFGVSVVGPKGRAGGASAAAGAMLNCFAEVTKQTFQTVPNRAKFEMCHKALKMWPKWLEEINEQVPFEDRVKMEEGTFVILNSKSGKLDTDSFFSILRALREYGEPHEEVNPSDILEINPLQNARPLRAVWIPGEGCVSASGLLRAFQWILKEAFIEREVEEILIEGNKAYGVRLVSGEVLYGEQIILAAGVFSQNLIDKIPELYGTMPLIFPGIGYSILAEQNVNRPFLHVVRTPNRGGACGLHVLPRDGAVYIGASNEVFYKPQFGFRMGTLNFLMQCAIEQIDQQFILSKVLALQVGNRPASLDSFPLVGKLSVENLFLVSGTYRDGFHQSPLIASHMAALLEGEKGSIPELFRPQRPLIQVNDKKGSIEEYLTHFQASSYEHNLLLPTGILTDQDYLEMIRKRTETLYDSLGTSFGIPPDMLFMFDLDPESRFKLDDYFKKMEVEMAAIS